MTLNELADQQHADLAALTRTNGRAKHDDPLLSPDQLRAEQERFDREVAAEQAAAPAPPETRQIDLTARRQELVNAHATALHQVHYLEGALNEIDYLLTLINPQPADTAEGESA